MTPIQSLSSSDWRALNAEAKFLRYLEALGISDYNKPNRLKRRLNKEHPNELREFDAVATRRMNENMKDDVYAIKNRNLPFSLLVTVADRGELHAKIFSQIDSISDPVSSVLDIGCENGFFTCLLALRWPNAKIVGIDRSEPALSRAHELVAKLNLKNVSFIKASAENLGDAIGDEYFDLVTTITVLHDSGLFPSIEVRPKRNSECFSACNIEVVPPTFLEISKTWLFKVYSG